MLDPSQPVVPERPTPARRDLQSGGAIPVIPARPKREVRTGELPLNCPSAYNDTDICQDQKDYARENEEGKLQKDETVPEEDETHVNTSGDEKDADLLLLVDPGCLENTSPDEEVLSRGKMKSSGLGAKDSAHSGSSNEYVSADQGSEPKDRSSAEAGISLDKFSEVEEEKTEMAGPMLHENACSATENGTEESVPIIPTRPKKSAFKRETSADSKSSGKIPEIADLEVTPNTVPQFENPSSCTSEELGEEFATVPENNHKELQAATDDPKELKPHVFNDDKKNILEHATTISLDSLPTVSLPSDSSSSFTTEGDRNSTPKEAAPSPESGILGLTGAEIVCGERLSAQPTVPKRPSRMSTPEVPLRPTKLRSAAAETQHTAKETVEIKPDDSPSAKKVPPTKPKKLSSKIAAFQQMFSQAPLEHTVPKFVPSERGRLSSNHTDFASNLQGMMGRGLPLPGMANSETIKTMSSVDGTDQSEQNSEPVSNINVARRAPGPRGKRLPKLIKETKIEVEPRFKVCVSEVWEVSLCKPVAEDVGLKSDVGIELDSTDCDSSQTESQLSGQDEQRNCEEKETAIFDIISGPQQEKNLSSDPANTCGDHNDEETSVDNAEAEPTAVVDHELGFKFGTSQEDILIEASETELGIADKEVNQSADCEISSEASGGEEAGRGTQDAHNFEVGVSGTADLMEDHVEFPDKTPSDSF